MARHDKGTKSGWFGGLFGSFGAKKAHAPKAKPVTTDHRHLADLELKQLVEFGPETTVHIVSLREYSAAIGPNWFDLRSKVMFLAETILTRLVSHGAIVSPCGDHFVIAFKRPSPRGNKQIVRDVSIELGQRLVGASFKLVSAAVQPAIETVEAKAKDVFGADGSLEAEVLDTVVAVEQAKRSEFVQQMEVITTNTAIETNFVTVETRRPPVNTNWERMKRDQNGGGARLVENNRASERQPGLVFGQARASTVVWK